MTILRNLSKSTMMQSVSELLYLRYPKGWFKLNLANDNDILDLLVISLEERSENFKHVSSLK